MDQGVSESPGRIVTLQRQRREVQAPLFFFCSLKSHYVTQGWSRVSDNVGAVCISGFKSFTMPTMLAETCRSSWTDKTHKTKIPMTKT